MVQLFQICFLNIHCIWLGYSTHSFRVSIQLRLHLWKLLYWIFYCTVWSNKALFQPSGIGAAYFCYCSSISVYFSCKIISSIVGIVFVLSGAVVALLLRNSRYFVWLSQLFLNYWDTPNYSRVDLYCHVSHHPYEQPSLS